MKSRELLLGGSILVCLTLPVCMQSTQNQKVNDAEAIATDKYLQMIKFNTGDHASSIKQNIELLTTGKNGTSIGWITSDAGTISHEGKVTRPANQDGDATVILTATISKGNESDTKEFHLIVKAEGASATGTMKDIEGNIYATIRIGNQIWTVDNLRSTKYYDGTAIPYVSDSAAWWHRSEPAYCYYNNMTEDDSIKKYGALYNWYVVKTGKLAPEGWRIPILEDWDTLKNYLINNGYNFDGTTKDNKIAKSMASITNWSASTELGAIGNDLSLNNSSGFTAIPGGYRSANGSFDGQQGSCGYWWSATWDGGSLAWYRYLGNSIHALGGSCMGMPVGCSVRLVRDY